ncbi:putative DNA-binding domain-containing protein [Sorangium sp. So ce302]|uniref:HvfC/BufC family peptide modification chaperone n=1 Tax=Sorangium sp. So ce302 TaxID=3133297 RepID=UPI003F61E572
MTLAALQETFWALVRDRRDAPAAELHFAGDARLSAAERMRIYRNMYWWRQIDAIQAELPKVAAVLGARFYDTAYAYLTAHPSEDGRLECITRRFPQWARAHGDPSLRRLADLATLEWMRSEAFLAPDPPALAAASAVDPEWFSAARLELVPSLATAPLDSDAEAQWDRAGTPPHDISNTALDVPAVHAAWRRKFSVFHKRLDADEGAALEIVRAGGTVGEACEAFASGADPAARAFEVVATWFRRGWIAAVRTPRSPAGRAE